jgi:cell division protease FtsH
MKRLRDRIAALIQFPIAVLRSSPIALGLSVVVLGLFILYFALLGSTAPAHSGKQIPLTRLVAIADRNELSSVDFYDEDARIVAHTTGGKDVYSAYPKSDAATADLIAQMSRDAVTVQINQQPGKARTRFIVQTLLPLIILAGLFGLVFLLISGKSAAADFAAFSKYAGKKSKTGSEHGITFADVAGCDEAILELAEVVDYLKDPTSFAAAGALAPKGCLLSGPPGTGKTLLARAVAGEAGVPFYFMSGSEFVESLVGVGAARVRDLFRQAREHAPAIIFIDELDAAGRQRGAGMGQGNDEREQTLNQILVELDGFTVSSGIVVLGATNRPDILDPALLRPGRFDRQVVVDAPDVEGRRKILALYQKGRRYTDDVDLLRLAKQIPGFTGAEIANLMNEAALMSVRRKHESITMGDLEESVDRVIAGPERRGHVLDLQERRLVAFHEAGHAVVAAGAGMETGVQKLSIVARGRTLGHTTTYQDEDRLVLKNSDLYRKLVTLLGGVAVEQLEFGEVTTASEGDLRQATSIARAMVATFGMGHALGRVAVGQKSGEVFLGRDFTKMQEIAPATLEAVDAEVRSILEQAEGDATQLLQVNRTIVEEIAEQLLEIETLSGATLDEKLARVVRALPHLLSGAVAAKRNGAPIDVSAPVQRSRPRTSR